MNFHVPLSESERVKHLECMDTQLPLDYLELLAQTDGIILDACHIYGLMEIRHIVCLDQNYYLLAEIDELGALGVKEGARNAELYLLQFEDSIEKPVGMSLQSALQDLLKLRSR